MCGGCGDQKEITVKLSKTTYYTILTQKNQAVERKFDERSRPHYKKQDS